MLGKHTFPTQLLNLSSTEASALTASCVLTQSNGPALLPEQLVTMQALAARLDVLLRPLRQTGCGAFVKGPETSMKDGAVADINVEAHTDAAKMTILSVAGVQGSGSPAAHANRAHFSRSRA